MTFEKKKTTEQRRRQQQLVTQLDYLFHFLFGFLKLLSFQLRRGICAKMAAGESLGMQVGFWFTFPAPSCSSPPLILSNFLPPSLQQDPITGNTMWGYVDAFQTKNQLFRTLICGIYPSCSIYIGQISQPSSASMLVLNFLSPPSPEYFLFEQAPGLL